MATPPGKRCKAILTVTGDRILLYSDADSAVLQLRREVPTLTDVAATSFKVGVPLHPAEMLELAGELLSVAATMLRQSPSQGLSPAALTENPATDI